MRKNLWIFGKIECILASLLFLVLCQRAIATDSPQRTKELKIALSAEYETLNPIVNSMIASIYVQDAAIRPIIAEDPKGLPFPVLIKEIPTFENKKLSFINSKKSLKASIEIRENASWADGEPVTCEDLKLTWEIGKSDNVAAPYHEDYTNIESITADSKNAKLCTVIFREARWDYFLSFPRPVPAHLERKVFEQFKSQPQGYERNSTYIKDPTNPGLYNGPYRVSELKIGSHVILLPNLHFYGKAPFFQKLIFKFILNSSAMESNLLTGGVDMTSSSGFSFDQAMAFEKKVKEKSLPYEVHFVEAGTYAHMDVNLDHEILQDIRVRKALAYGFDREAMTKAFFQDKQKAAFSFSSYLDTWFTADPKDIQTYPYDKAKASALLEEAGWKMESDHYRHKNGKKLSFVVSGVVDQKMSEMLEVYVQNEWKKIGVDLQIKNYPARVLLSDIVRHRQFDLAFYSWINTPNNVPFNMMHSSQIPSAANSWAGSNRTGWNNPEVDKALEQVLREFDAGRRTKLMRKVLRSYTEELPSLPCYFKSSNSVTPVGLKNFALSGHAFTEYLHIEDWGF